VTPEAIAVCNLWLWLVCPSYHFTLSSIFGDRPEGVMKNFSSNGDFGAACGSHREESKIPKLLH